METGEGEPKEKDIVWAKIKGYPWWPGTIRAISSHKNQNNNKKFSKKKVYTVDFIGNKSHGEVSKNDINLFKQNYEEHCKTKNPSLIKSIELAKKLYQEKANNSIIGNRFHNDDDDDETKGKINNKDNYLLGKKRKKIMKIAHGYDDEEDNKKDGRKNNDIKINININVTNNNQRTVNINSFSSNLGNLGRDAGGNINVKERNNKSKSMNIIRNKIKNRNKHKKNEDDEFIFDEEEDESENYDDNKEYDFYEKSIVNELLDIKKPNHERYNYNNKLYNNNNNNNNMNLKQKKRKKKLIRGTNININSNTEKEKDKKSIKSSGINENSDLDIGLNVRPDMFKNSKNIEDLDKIIHNLVNYQIQISNNQNQKMIIKELNKLQNIMNNNNNDSGIKIYHNYNALYKILSTFTYNKNSEIVSKSAEMLSNLPNTIIKNIFILSKEEEQNLLFNNITNINSNDNIEEEEEQYINIELQKICDFISKQNNNVKEKKENISRKSKMRIKKNKSKANNNIKDSIKDNNTKENNMNDNTNTNFKDESFISFDSSCNNSNDCNDSNGNGNNSCNNNFSDNIINIIINELSDYFYHISDNFFKNVYNKNDIGLEKKLAMKRKFVCIKLFTLFKKTFPKLEEDYIKKIILFFEYKIRSDDPTLGQKYTKEIDELYYKVKNINNQK